MGYLPRFFLETLPFLKPYLTKDVFFRISAGRETRNQLHLALSPNVVFEVLQASKRSKTSPASFQASFGLFWIFNNHEGNVGFPCKFRKFPNFPMSKRQSTVGEKPIEPVLR